MQIPIRREADLDQLQNVDEEPLRGYFFTNEDGAHKFIVTCKRSGTVVQLTGAVSARFERADGNTVYLGTGASDGRESYAFVDDDGKAVAVLHADCYNIPGKFRLTIFLTENDVTTAIYSAVGIVYRTSEGNIIDSGEAVPSLDDLNAAMREVNAAKAQTIAATTAANNAAQTANTAATNADSASAQAVQRADAAIAKIGNALNYIAPEYNASANYAAGAYVTYDAKLYKSTQSTSGNAPTDTAYWQEATVISMANDALTQEAESVIGGMTVTASTVTGNPTAEMTKQGGHFALALGIPKGAKGDPGDPGANGLNVRESRTQYYLSDNPLNAAGGYWSDTVPHYEVDHYYFVRAVTVLTDGTTTYGTAHIDNALTDTYAALLELDGVSESLNTKIDGWYIEDNTLYLTANGVVIGGGISNIGGGGGGGGGGGSTNDAVLTLTNGVNWLAKTIRYGAALAVTINWSSLLHEVPTGVGSLKVIVNNAIRSTLNVQQGAVTVNVGEYLNAGTNTVRLTITDLYGNSRSLVYTVTSINVSVRSGFDTSMVYTEPFIFPYTPVGSVEKTVHVKLDGVEQETFTTSVSNRQLSYIIPAQSHGGHSIELWFTATVDNETVESNHLYYEYIYAVAGDTTPIIVSNYNAASVTQYSTVPIPYRVYDPATQQTVVTIYEGETPKSTLTVGREEQSYSYRAARSGEQTVRLAVGEVYKDIRFTVTAVDIDVDAETDGLQLYLTSNGRNNGEANPATWVSGDVAATFSGFNWASDGWQQDTDGVTVLRVKDDARVVIPYQIFAEDFRTSGRTIELEFATHDVSNYDTPIITCMSGWRGFTVTPQGVTFASEQSTISTQYKDDEHVRLSFVVQKRSEQKLIMVYINGIVSGVVQYPDNDDFSQVLPVDISLGCSSATLDVYAIRVYDHDLTRHQVLTNWIADTQDGMAMVSRFRHNDVFDAYGNIVISKLPNDLPYMTISGPLPQSKGDKKTVSGEYVDPLDATKSFTFERASIDVQGTSSQYYARKNYKIKFSGGFTNAGVTASKYAMNADAIPVSTFTFKADVASSEGANNVELARLYNMACPYKTPYQKANAKVRQGIDGFPMVIFHDDGTDVTFLGKYNFNNDKGTKEVFGFSEGDESWEILNNTSNRVLWKSADYSGDDWKNDFEARYPEDSTDVSNLSAFAAWLVSVDAEAATGAKWTNPVDITYNGVTTRYTHDNKAYRLAKFKAELADWAEVDSLLFFYLFTELFLMVDNRAKNAFPSRMGGDKWCILPYDFDTALGINNEGQLAFSYNLEDTDLTPKGEDVYNGQHSVLWCNLRDAYPDELREMYRDIRAEGIISYENVEKMFEDHQGKWPEAIFNEDAQYKYLDPLIDDNDASYLEMLQGSKAEQRKWWMYNRFRYIDSKYNAGYALTDVITLRGYAKASITVTPYADIYPTIKYGSYLVGQRGQRNIPVTLVNPMDNVSDTEIYVYSASQLASIGDLSGLKVGYANFSMATKLQSIKIGDSSSSYSNGNLVDLYFGNNTLLRTVDVRNCPALAKAVDMSGCTSLETAYFDGTSVTGVSLPNGGVVKTLHLPGTITNLTILNQTGITDFTCPSFANVTTLRLENVSSRVNTLAIVQAMIPGGRVRLYNFHWELASLTELITLYDKLDTMRGLDQGGNNVPTAQLFGSVHVASANGSELAELGDRYPDVTVTYDALVSNLYYYSFDGNTLLHTDIIQNGGNGVWNQTPSTPSNTDQYVFGSFVGWSLTPQSNTADENARNNVTADRKIYAAFTATVRTYDIKFYLDSQHGGTLLYTQTGVPYGDMPVYGGSTPQSALGSDYEWDGGWSPALHTVTGANVYYATFIDMAIPLYKYLKRTIETYESDNVQKIASYAFYECDKLTTVEASATSVGDNAFGYCTGLQEVDLTAIGSIAIGAYICAQASTLKRVIIRSGTVASADYYMFMGGTSANGNVNPYALIYVPDSLVSSYQSTAPFSTNAIYSGRIRPISEMYEHEICYEPITDSDAVLFEAINNRTAHTKYKVGQYKTLTINGQDIRFMIAGFNMRELADGSGTAEIEWIAKSLIESSVGSGRISFSQQYNPAYEAGVEGTGTLGGYDKSEIKTFVDETVFQMFPEAWRNMMKETKIVTVAYDSNGNLIRNHETTAVLRIPSARELNLSGVSENDGPSYTDVFYARNLIPSPGAAYQYWLRTAATTTSAYYIYASDAKLTSAPTTTKLQRVAVGFST